MQSELCELGNLSTQSDVLLSGCRPFDFWANCPVSSATCCSSRAFASRCRLLSAVRALINVALRSLRWPASNKRAVSSASWSVSLLIKSWFVSPASSRLDFLSRSLMSVFCPRIFSADSRWQILIPSSMPLALARSAGDLSFTFRIEGQSWSLASDL